ncbi:MAG: toxin co-regulated pilus biosynthesis Q family protein, partial [Flavobacterium sp.]|nr:toxin co-regulated pilus biosynthesis Q family protein [Flavobacterium sp.]MCU0394122.1 toxin co-regulated pilus biosynthesis Q family protein [Thermoflexibacter sp.]
TSSWVAASGSTLRETLTSWAQKNNAYLEWQSPYDYPITNAFSFEGEFAGAVEELLTLYQSDKNPPKGKLYPNQPNGPVVLVVK